MSNARRKMARETQALMERALAATCPSTGKPYTLEDTRPLPPKAVKRAMQEAFQSNSSQTALFNRLAYAGADGSAETWQNAPRRTPRDSDGDSRKVRPTPGP
jgi:hypothetical protein